MFAATRSGTGVVTRISKWSWRLRLAEIDEGPGASVEALGLLFWGFGVAAGMPSVRFRPTADTMIIA